jgi:hypothetical protein
LPPYAAIPSAPSAAGEEEEEEEEEDSLEVDGVWVFATRPPVNTKLQPVEDEKDENGNTNDDDDDDGAAAAAGVAAGVADVWGNGCAR